MPLIKTDNQNYTDIAEAIRWLVGGTTIFDMDITTTSNNDNTNTYYIFSEDNDGTEFHIDNYEQRVGEVFEITYDNVSYSCEFKKHLLDLDLDLIAYYFGNISLSAWSDSDTKEPFFIWFVVDNDGLFYTAYSTTEAGTHHFTINKKRYKPEEMAPALDGVFPDYGVSYDTLSGDGSNPVTGSTYGYKAVGFAENSALSSVNISDKTREIGDYAFHYCNQLSISTLPEGVEIIGRSAFYRCNAITSFTFPKSIKKIGGSAFDYCSSLKTVTFKGTPDEIASTAFAMNSGITFNVPWSEGEVAGYPWGASNSTINYNYTG